MLADCIVPDGFDPAGSSHRRPLNFNIFIAFPKDAAQMAERVRDACDELNRTHDTNDFVLRPKMWNETCYLVFNSDAQLQIEDQQGSPSTCQIVIAVCNYRLGPGTRGEIEKAIAATPRGPALFWLMPETLLVTNGHDEAGKAVRREWEDLGAYIEGLKQKYPDWFPWPLPARSEEELVRQSYERTKDQVGKLVNKWIEQAFPRHRVSPPLTLDEPP